MDWLKITQSGFEGYNGPIGPVEFKNGISVEPVPVVLADRLAGVMTMVRVDEAGNEVGQAGVAARMVGGVTIRAEVVEPLEVANEEQLIEDRRILAESQQRPPVSRIYSVIELKAIADEKGINGLREIAKPWGVKERSIPKLIHEIMIAQDAFLERIRENEARAKADIGEGKLVDNTKQLEFSYIDPVTGAAIPVLEPSLPSAQTPAPVDAPVDQMEETDETDTAEKQDEKPAGVEPTEEADEAKTDQEQETAQDSADQTNSED